MWIHKGDTVEQNNKVLTVERIDGLYSVASNITITLKDEENNSVQMNYMEDFFPKYQSGQIKSVNIKVKQSRGY